ncbi:hypothetical protein ACI79D_09565 [Geodermatophilus sp. SYSU D00708]
MSVMVVRLRWGSLSDGEEERLRTLVRPGSWYPDGCHCRRLTREGCALVLTEIWADRAAAERGLGRLCRGLRAAGVAWPGASVTCLPANGFPAV